MRGIGKVPRAKDSVMRWGVREFYRGFFSIFRLIQEPFLLLLVKKKRRGPSIEE
jgi:hypothetical protein